MNSRQVKGIASALLFGALIAVPASMAAAADQTLTGGAIGASGTAVSVCNANPGVESVTSQYVASSQRYEIHTMVYTPAASCFGSGEYSRVTLSNFTGPTYDPLTNGGIALSLAAGAAPFTYTYPDGSGPEIDEINSNNSQVLITTFIFGTG